MHSIGMQGSVHMLLMLKIPRAYFRECAPCTPRLTNHETGIIINSLLALRELLRAEFNRLDVI